MSVALRRLGFEETTELDADRVELPEALRAFTRQSVEADVALVFHAAHGIAMDSGNYLLPVGCALRDGDAGGHAGVDVGRVPAAGDSGCGPEQLRCRVRCSEPRRAPSVSAGRLRGRDHGHSGAQERLSKPSKSLGWSGS